MSPVRYVVALSAQALRQLDSIDAYLRIQGAPLAAESMGARFKRAIDDLELFPHRGRSVGRDLRELATVRPYVIRYRVTTGTVQIIRIRHGAQRPDLTLT